MTKAGRLLLSRGADINHKDHSGVWHPLKGHFLLFESLILTDEILLCAFYFEFGHCFDPNSCLKNETCVFIIRDKRDHIKTSPLYGRNIVKHYPINLSIMQSINQSANQNEEVCIVSALNKYFFLLGVWWYVFDCVICRQDTIRESTAVQ